jgi:glycosyltransferase involved in cell wall biosynthesis
MNKIAIIVQRCHENIVGGSEAHAWQYATLLKNDFHVDVLTTTAVDAATWANDLPEGIEQRNGVTVHRFKVDQGRTPYWHALHERLLQAFEYRRKADNGSKQPGQRLYWRPALQEEFIRKQGPYSEGLLSFLSARSHQYKAFIFLTYLFPTTYFGIPRCPKAACLLVPTLHDEPPAYLTAYAQMARKVRSVLWNTEAEQRFGTRLWGDLPGRIVGMGIQTRPHQPSKQQYPYLLYCGRIDPYKGCDQLIEFFLQFKKNHPSDLRLIFTGKVEINPPPTGHDIIFKGFVSEDEKFQLMAGALCFVMPSPYESLSIVTLEAMAQCTPVIVNGACEVLVDHVRQSGAGAVYRSYDSFANSLNNLLACDPDEAAATENRAREYVVSRYNFDKIREILIQEIESSDGSEPNMVEKDSR